MAKRDELELELVYRHEGNDHRVALVDGHFRIGRRSRCEVWLPDPSVSKIHAFLMREGDRLTLEDARSFNGTYVNDVKVDTCGLHAGDEVRLGTFTLHVVYAGAPVPSVHGLVRPRRVLDRTAITVAAVVTLSLGLGVYAALRGFSRASSSKEATVAESLTPAQAYRRSVDAYLLGNLAEARRYSRQSEEEGAYVLRALVEQELRDLRLDSRVVDWKRRVVLLRRVLKTDPPAPLRERAREALASIERSGQGMPEARRP